MSEEEKKIKNVQEMFEDIPIKEIESQSITIYGTAILDIIEVLNLIEKQQKEIEELEKLKVENLKLLKEIDKKQEQVQTYKITSMQNFATAFINNNYISKDKIRKKIEEIENSCLKENIKACVCNTLAQLL